jgi:hypothetical protein
MHIRRSHALATEFPFLQAQLNNFLDTSPDIDGYDSGLMLRFWAMEADRFLLAVRLRHTLKSLPVPPRTLSESLLRKEILYAVDSEHRPLAYTSWNRNESQRLRDIFRTAAAADTRYLCLIVREQCLRRTRKKRLVTQLCLHGVIILAPRNGFHSIT